MQEFKECSGEACLPIYTALIGSSQSTLLSNQLSRDTLKVLAKGVSPNKWFNEHRNLELAPIFIILSLHVALTSLPIGQLANPRFPSIL